jgi:hypothetical protein
MITKVINVSGRNRDELEADPDFVYIGRGDNRNGWSPSKWGNYKFRIGRDGTREEVIAKHAKWFPGSDLVADLHELKGKTLGCHCKPKACHGDVLARLADALPEA